jgi:hypothetical protein
MSGSGGGEEFGIGICMTAILSHALPEQKAKLRNVGPVQNVRLADVPRWWRRWRGRHRYGTQLR